MEKASNHKSKSTAAYLAKKDTETVIKCFPFDEIRVKSPYASVMNFCAFGLLKRTLEKWHLRTHRMDFGKRFKRNGLKFG
ncbi:hypothetical protein TNCV_1968481 [Trichonephila clavipes]|nr:hypothetical protein TNCV_1968481 [Trichonephila clavipes]